MWSNGYRDHLGCRSGLIKGYESGLYYVSAKHAALPRKQKQVGWKSQLCVILKQHVNLRNVVSVSKHYKNPTKCDGFVQNGNHHNPTQRNLFSPSRSCKINHLA